MLDESAVTVGDATWRDEAFGETQRGKAHVFFYARQVQHAFKSEQEGRPIFVEKIFIKKLLPGDNRLIIDREIRNKDMAEHPIEWARYQQKKSSQPEGTPIEAWSLLSDTQKAEFRALNIFTIDQFASLPDSAGEKIMGFHKLREKAQTFIAASKDSALLDKIRAESNARIAEQDKKIADLTALLEAMTKPQEKVPA